MTNDALGHKRVFVQLRVVFEIEEDVWNLIKGFLIN